MVANICPMKPSGVQLTRPICAAGPARPGAARRRLVWWCGANMMPTHERTASNSPSEYGRASASASCQVRVTSAAVGVPAPRLQQLGRQVGGDDVGAGEGGRDGALPRAGGDVEDPLPGLEGQASDDGLAEVGDELGGDGVVVAEGPHGAVRWPSGRCRTGSRVMAVLLVRSC